MSEIETGAERAPAAGQSPRAVPVGASDGAQPLRPDGAAGAASLLPLKHCPECGRTYQEEVRAYCSYHPTLLVSGAPSAQGSDMPGSPDPKAEHRRGRLWAMTVVALSAGGLIASVIYF